MRIAKLRRIKLLLDQVIAKKGYFIYLAPLLNEHYNRYIELIHTNYETSENLANVLTNEEILRDTSTNIDIRTDILVDTNLYVSRLGTNDLDLGHELIAFAIEEGINYRFLITDDELIREFENKPENTINE
jgi:hypothetical protein